MTDDGGRPPPERVPRWLTWGSVGVVALYLWLMLDVPWELVLVTVISLVIWGVFAPVIYK
jgi:hypothetical protein